MRFIGKTTPHLVNNRQTSVNRRVTNAVGSAATALTHLVNFARNQEQFTLWNVVRHGPIEEVRPCETVKNQFAVA